MAKVLARVAPWLQSARTGSRIRSGQHTGTLRVLARADTPALRALAAEDPVANIFIASHLEAAGSAAPTAAGGQIVGLFEADRLVSACWAGVNLVPIGVNADTGPELGAWLARSGRRFSSVFGPAEGVLSVWSELQHASPRPFAIRGEQPLLQIQAPSPVPPAAGLRHTRPEQLDVLLPACTAMFEEEVGYSPVAGGDRHYRNRVRGLIQRGHSLSHIVDSEVIFKAELGTVSRDAVQIQGVWMNPAHRGRGLSAAYMSAVVDAALEVAPTVSLYVNAYNDRARAVYSTVGFRQVGTFATVLF